jgi:hypothetical protein
LDLVAKLLDLGADVNAPAAEHGYGFEEKAKPAGGN